jgi:hypothetical protein
MLFEIVDDADVCEAECSPTLKDEGNAGAAFRGWRVFRLEDNGS